MPEVFGKVKWDVAMTLPGSRPLNQRSHLWFVQWLKQICCCAHWLVSPVGETLLQSDVCMRESGEIFFLPSIMAMKNGADEILTYRYVTSFFFLLHKTKKPIFLNISNCPLFTSMFTCQQSNSSLPLFACWCVSLHISTTNCWSVE